MLDRKQKLIVIFWTLHKPNTFSGWTLLRSGRSGKISWWYSKMSEEHDKRNPKIRHRRYEESFFWTHRFRRVVHLWSVATDSEDVESFGWTIPTASSSLWITLNTNEMTSNHLLSIILTTTSSLNVRRRFSPDSWISSLMEDYCVGPVYFPPDVTHLKHLRALENGCCDTFCYGVTLRRF